MVAWPGWSGVERVDVVSGEVRKGGEGGLVEWDGIGRDERNGFGVKKWEVEMRRRRCRSRKGVQWWWW